MTIKIRKPFLKRGEVIQESGPRVVMFRDVYAGDAMYNTDLIVDGEHPPPDGVGIPCGMDNVIVWPGGQTEEMWMAYWYGDGPNPNQKQPFAVFQKLKGWLKRAGF